MHKYRKERRVPAYLIFFKKEGKWRNMGVQDWIVKKRTAREKERDPSDVSVLEEPLWPCFSAEIQPFLLT